ncbi:MAG: tRNA pseudouridine(55) synthase TruB [Lachnospiraceae bacterium]|nr:tRNA pseudouridine(55) synthase TruB [Lachnospiraceae bacterium]
MDGILNIYKEPDFTSHDVVAKLRGILHQKKIGHTGTLDPAAMGVLPVCCGKATKVCELLAEKDKTYQAVCKLGVVTDTQDDTGEILEEHSFKDVTEEEVREAAVSFLGESSQIPPMYSAIKVHGKKLYELAREGKTVEREPRSIYISQLDILQVDLEEGTILIEVTCSKGTYIRTLCHDIGGKLGTGAVMQSLVRTRVADFVIEEAVTLGELERLLSEEPEEFQRKLIPVDSLFPEYPRKQILPEYTKHLFNGNILEERYLRDLDGRQEEPGGKVLVYDQDGGFKAVYRRQKNNYAVVKMF